MCYYIKYQLSGKSGLQLILHIIRQTVASICASIDLNQALKEHFDFDFYVITGNDKAGFAWTIVVTCPCWQVVVMLFNISAEFEFEIKARFEFVGWFSRKFCFSFSLRIILMQSRHTS